MARDYDVAISHGSRLVKIPQYKLVVKAVDSSTTPDVPKIYGVTVRRLDRVGELVEHKSPQQSPEIQELLNEYADCFVETNPFGVIQEAVHRIDTKDDLPVTSRRMSWQEQRQLKVELDQLLGTGLIRPSDGVWSSPVLFVGKKDGSLRFCVDYRKLNEKTIRDTYPLPHIDELLDSLGDGRVFSTLDAASGFWQTAMDPASIAKTGFVTRYGTYEFKVVPFGLTGGALDFSAYHDEYPARVDRCFLSCDATK